MKTICSLFVVLVSLLAGSGCCNPKAMNNASLISVLPPSENEADFVCRRRIAAELGCRPLTEAQVEEVVNKLGVVDDQPYEENLLGSLRSILAQKRSVALETRVRDLLVERLPLVKDPDTAAFTARLVVDLTRDRNEIYGFALKQLADSPHAKVRFWSIWMLDQWFITEKARREECLQALHARLVNETSASVAELICRIIQTERYEPAKTLLDEISQVDSKREFSGDSFKWRAMSTTDVREAAVRASNAIARGESTPAPKESAL